MQDLFHQDYLHAGWTHPNNICQLVILPQKTRWNYKTYLKSPPIVLYYGWWFRNPANQLSLVVYPVYKDLYPSRCLFRLESSTRLWRRRLQLPWVLLWRNRTALVPWTLEPCWVQTRNQETRHNGNLEKPIFVCICIKACKIPGYVVYKGMQIYAVYSIYYLYTYISCMCISLIISARTISRHHVCCFHVSFSEVYNLVSWNLRCYFSRWHHRFRH